MLSDLGAETGRNICLFRVWSMALELNLQLPLYSCHCSEPPPNKAAIQLRLPYF